MNGKAVMTDKQRYIEKLHKEVADLKKQLQQLELREKAKKSLFATVSVERLTEENKKLQEENKFLSAGYFVTLYLI